VSWSRFFRRRRWYDERQREIQEYLDVETDENISRGMHPKEAREAAHRKFGSQTLVQEEIYRMNSLNTFETLWQDMQYGWRMLWKNPGITAVSLLSLALGIGATTCIFSVIYGVLISPYPYAKANEIWAPELRDAKNPKNTRGVLLPYEFQELERLPGVSVAMGTRPEEALLTGDRTPETIRIPLVTPKAFDFLGVRPVMGRTIGDGDWQPNGDPEDVIVLSYKAWYRYFDGNPDALGKTLVINDRKVAVIGVMPPRFGWFTDDGGWMPFTKTPTPDRWVLPIVRLKPGIGSTVVTEQLQAVESRLQAEHPGDFPKNSSVVVHLNNYLDITVASGNMSNSLEMLFGAVGFLLLIACANVANLQMARATSRAREIALRMSIGASRARVLRQLLTESMLLSLTGGLLGVAVAIGLTKAVVAIMPEFYVPNEARISVNGYVLAFSATVSIATGILFGLVPALQCSRPDLVEDLKGTGKGSGNSGAGGKTRGALVIVEVALSVVLLIGASLTIRGFVDLERVELGYNPAHMVLINVQVNPKKYATYQQRINLIRDVLARVKALPGVKGATIGTGEFSFATGHSTFAIDGKPADDSQFLLGSMVSDDYAKTLGVAVRAGREITAQEIAHGDHVGMINETLAKMWPAGENPIGRRVRVDALGKESPRSPHPPGTLDPYLTVVGVLADTRNAGLREPTRPAIYFPYTLAAPSDRLLLYRAQGDPLLLLNAVRQQVLAIDKEQPIGKPYTLEQVLGFETVQPKFNMALFTFFGVLGLTLATVGIFSVLSYMVARRTHEIGIRIALGAQPGDVVRLTIRSGGVLVAIGLAVGLAGSFALGTAIRSQVFSVPVTDPVAIGGVIVVMSISAALACLIPARRASRVDPMIALRNE
jgi:predicted permease